MQHLLRAACCAAFFTLAAGAAHAQTPSNPLTFGQLPNEVDIENYFDGGLSGYPPSGTGPADGLIFSGNANEQKTGTRAPAGTGRFENNPSGVNGVLYFAFSTSTISYVDDPTGFMNLSFAYSLLDNEISQQTAVDIWSGLNGTGTLLDSIPLDAATNTVACTKSGDEFCTWSTVGASGFGVAESFTVPGTNTATDQVEFDALVTVPEPASITVFATLLSGLAVARRRKRR